MTGFFSQEANRKKPIVKLIIKNLDNTVRHFPMLPLYRFISFVPGLTNL